MGPYVFNLDREAEEKMLILPPKHAWYHMLNSAIQEGEYLRIISRKRNRTYTYNFRDRDGPFSKYSDLFTSETLLRATIISLFPPNN